MSQDGAKPDDTSNVDITVGNIHVDKAVVVPARDRRKTLIEMTPLLSILITAIALLTTSGIQIWQQHSNKAEQTDAEWRSSLAKISDNEDALVGTLEMQTFLDVDRYRDRAGSIIAVKMPKIADEQEFDSVFDVMPSRIDMRNQIILVNVARAITRDLADQYNLMMLAAPAGHKPTASMRDFVLDPEGAGATGAVLSKALSDTWKLDSTIRGLQAVWTRKGLDGATSPASTDLSGIEFYAADKVVDFSSVNFQNADFGGSEFIGACIVTDPNARAVDHCNPRAVGTKP